MSDNEHNDGLAHGGVEPDNVAAGKLAAITIILGGLLFVSSVGVAAWVMKVTRDVQDERAAVATVRIDELEAEQSAVLAAAEGVTVPVAGSEIDPLSIDEAMQRLLDNPDQYLGGTAELEDPAAQPGTPDPTPPPPEPEPSEAPAEPAEPAGGHGDGDGHGHDDHAGHNH